MHARRSGFLELIESRFRIASVVALLGPRQVGKTTLARQYAKGRKAAFYDLENPLDLARLESPMLSLEEHSGLVVIDEIQRRPELFPALRVLADRPRRTTKFLILGSASRDLIQQSSESLAGRISYLELFPFSVGEHDRLDAKKLHLRGGFPRSCLAPTDASSFQWRQDYIAAYLERDLPALGLSIPPAQLRRFWLMVTHYHAQTWNASHVASSMDLSPPTARRYLDILIGTFMCRQLQPWFANISKRQVKAPKIYFKDSGLFHALLGVRERRDMLAHPLLGASWEGFALESVVRRLNVRHEECFFWGVHAQGEIDLLIPSRKGLLGFEFKYTDRPAVTPSIRLALKNLPLEKLNVIFPGKSRFALDKKVEAVGLEAFCLSD